MLRDLRKVLLNLTEVYLGRDVFLKIVYMYIALLCGSLRSGIASTRHNGKNIYQVKGLDHIKLDV